MSPDLKQAFLNNQDELIKQAIEKQNKWKLKDYNSLEDVVEVLDKEDSSETLFNKLLHAFRMSKELQKDKSLVELVTILAERMYAESNALQVLNESYKVVYDKLQQIEAYFQNQINQQLQHQAYIQERTMRTPEGLLVTY